MKSFIYFILIIVCLLINLSSAQALARINPLEKLKPDIFSQIKIHWNASGNAEERFILKGSKTALRVVGPENVIFSSSEPIPDGKYVSHYDSGLISREINYLSGKRNGEGRLYFDNGKVFCVEQYNDDVLDRVSYFDETGQVLARLSAPDGDDFTVLAAKLSPPRYYELLKRVVFEHICNNRDITRAMTAAHDLLSGNSGLLFSTDDFLDFILKAEKSVNITLESIKYDRPVVNGRLFSYIPESGYDRYLQLIREIHQLTPKIEYLHIILNQLAINDDGRIDGYLAQLHNGYPNEDQTYNFYMDYVQGNRAYLKKQYDPAADSLKKSLVLIDLYFQDLTYRTTVMLRLGECYARLGNYTDAIGYFSLGFNRLGNDLDFSGDDLSGFFYWYAVALEKTGDYFTAAQYYAKLPSDKPALKALGLIYINKLESRRNAWDVIKQCRPIDLVLYNYLLDEYEKKFGLGDD